MENLYNKVMDYVNFRSQINEYKRKETNRVKLLVEAKQKELSSEYSVLEEKLSMIIKGV